MISKEKGQGKARGDPKQIRAGDKIGHLDVLSVSGTTAVCKCACGKETAIPLKDLKNGRKKTCGCGLRSEKRVRPGMVIREVKVIEPAEPKIFKTGTKKQWIVECIDCHFQRTMRETDLVCEKISICPKCKNRKGESV